MFWHIIYNQLSIPRSAATLEQPAYDADGNLLTYDGWACAWNAQDRLVSATKGDTRLEFNYDYLGRRFEKKVYEDNVLVKHQLFVYDGFKQIAEYDALDSNALANTYVWQPAGLDVPLLRNGSEFLVSDANKNIVALLDTTGSVTDTYTYEPFGNCAHTGTSANPFRFSSEYFDAETGLVYYNYRYYSPELGRWISRDPIGENGGMNLLSFCSNNGVFYYDTFGLLNTHLSNHGKITLYYGLLSQSNIAPRNPSKNKLELDNFNGFIAEPPDGKCNCWCPGTLKMEKIGEYYLVQKLRDYESNGKWKLDGKTEKYLDTGMPTSDNYNPGAYADAPGLHPITLTPPSYPVSLDGTIKKRDYRIELWCNCEKYGYKYYTYDYIMTISNFIIVFIIQKVIK